MRTKKAKSFSRFHYEHSTPILSNCLYMFCRIMQPAVICSLSSYLKWALYLCIPGGGGIARARRGAEPSLAHSPRDQGKAHRSGTEKMWSQVKGRRPCPRNKEPSDRAPLLSIFKVPWCLGPRREPGFLRSGRRWQCQRWRAFCSRFCAWP